MQVAEAARRQAGLMALVFASPSKDLETQPPSLYDGAGDPDQSTEHQFQGWKEIRRSSLKHFRLQMYNLSD